MLSLRGLKLGETLHGRVEELLPAREVLISFDGDFLRVQNETGRRLRIGEPVSLIVKAIHPIRFQLVAERSEQRRKGQIDVSI